MLKAGANKTLASYQSLLAPLPRGVTMEWMWSVNQAFQELCMGDASLSPYPPRALLNSKLQNTQNFFYCGSSSSSSSSRTPSSSSSSSPLCNHETHSPRIIKLHIKLWSWGCKNLTQNMQRNLPHWLGSFLLFTNLQFFLGNTTIEIDWVRFSQFTTLQIFWGKYNSRPTWQVVCNLPHWLGSFL